MASWVELAPAPRRSGRDRAGVRIIGRSFLHILAVASICLATLAAASPAQALLVGPGDSAEISFVFATPPDAGGETVDLLILTMSPTFSTGPTISVLSRLFDGTTLLGSGVQPISGFTAFGDGIFPNAFSANLDTVRSGTIDGRIVLTPVFPGGTGFVEFDPSIVQVRAAHGFARNALLATPGATIRAVGIPVAQTPVPPALLLFGSALAVLGFVLYRRRAGPRRATRRGSPSSTPCSFRRASPASSDPATPRP